MKKKNTLYLGIFLLLALVVLGIKRHKQNNCGFEGGCPAGVCTLPIPAGRPRSELTEIKATQGTNQPLPTLLELGSDECMACKRLMPVVIRLKNKFKGELDAEIINVRTHPDAADIYGIRTVPTLIFFDAEGHELLRREGYMEPDEILAAWRELGFPFEETSPTP